MTREARRDRRRRDVLCERRFALWLTPAEYASLSLMAGKAGTSKAEAVKRLLRAYAGQERAV